MNHADILTGVRECLASALDIDTAGIRESDKIVDGLGADSLDLLDLTFQLEQRFKITISLRDMERQAKEKMQGRALDVDGVYTPEALVELRKAMPDIPASELPDGLTTAELPRRLRVATMVRLVERLLEKNSG